MGVALKMRYSPELADRNVTISQLRCLRVKPGGGAINQGIQRHPAATKNAPRKSSGGKNNEVSGGEVQNLAFCFKGT